MSAQSALAVPLPQAEAELPRTTEEKSASFRPAEPRRYTIAEYLEMDCIPGVRLEYNNGIITAKEGEIVTGTGEIIYMAGSSLPHNRVAGRIYNCFERAFEDRPCEAFIEDIKVRVSPAQFR